ncbi:MAG: hypothetical protein WBD20_21680 [Pirellulaceae bacterium]
MLSKTTPIRALRQARKQLRELILRLTFRREEDVRPNHQPIAGGREFSPTVRALEPRFVLNATAELTSLGQLILTGDAGFDSLKVTELPDASISITDSTGNIIPIVNHPGVDTDPLPVSAVTSGQLQIDLGGGDDTLNLDLPSTLDVTLVESEGHDETNLRFSDRVDAAAQQTVQVASETITINLGDSDVDLTNDHVQLTGDVFLGVSGSTTNINFGAGDFSVDGTVQLADDVSFFAAGGSLDFSDAVLSARRSGTDVSFLLNQSSDSNLTLGVIDNSAGAKIEQFSIDSATSVDFTNPVDLDGDLTVQGVASTTNISGSIVADSLQIRSVGEVRVDGNLTVTDGVISLVSNQRVVTTATIDTTLAGDAGSISMISPIISMNGSNMLTDGGDIAMIGDTQIDGQVTLDSAYPGSAGVAGDIRFFGTVNSADQIGDELILRSVGQLPSGTVQIQGDVGATAASPLGQDLNGLSISAGLIDLRSVGIIDGDMVLMAPLVRMSGSQWIVGSSSGATNTILIDGKLTLPSDDARIESTGNLTITDDIVGRVNSEALVLVAGSNVNLNADATSFQDLKIQAGQQATVGGNVNVRGAVTISAAAGVGVFASSITSTEEIVFTDEVTFHVDSILNSNAIRFDASVTTNANTMTTLLATLADPLQSNPNLPLQIVKSGDGTLLLAAHHQYSAETIVQAGTLEVRGSIDAGAGPVTVNAGATLSGSGVIDADIRVQSGGRFAPGDVLGSGTVSLQTQSVEFESRAIYEIQLDGFVAGSQYDQLLIGQVGGPDESISLDGAILDLQLNHSPPPATEFVIIRNDGTDDVTGRLSVNFDQNGVALAVPRVLDEGALVRSPFGADSSAAFITYFGGDGNDVAIVTAGDVSLDVDQVTLITRNGTDLEIRTGSDQAEAEAASPTIRPIAGLNENRLIINDTTGNDVVLLDIDGLIDASGNTLSFVGKISFVGEASDFDNDRIVLFDSNPSTDDLPTAIDYAIDDDRAGSMVVTNGAVSFGIQFTGLESFDQTITPDQVSFGFAASDQQINIDVDAASPQRTLVSGQAGSQATTQVSLNNPTESLYVGGGDGADQITMNGFGSGGGGFAAALTIDGLSGDDTVVLNADLTLGSVVSPGDLTLRGETVSLIANVDTNSGLVAGNVRITGGNLVTVGAESVINTGDGTIVIDGNGGQIDTGRADLVSQFDGDAIVIENASQVLIGDIDATRGRLVIGRSGNISGAVAQQSSTLINVDQLSVNTQGPVDLANDSNQIGSIDGIVSGGGVIVVDATDDLAVSGVNSVGADVMIMAQGTIGLQNQAVRADGAVVTLSAGGSIIDLDPDNSMVNVQGGIINLIAGALGIGRADNTLDADATESINADTGVFGGDIFLGNVGGALPIGLIDAGTGNVFLIADSIDDASDDNVTDVVAASLTISTSEGFGGFARIEFDDVDNLTLGGQGDIDIAWVADTETTIHRIVTDAGDIRLHQSGGQRLEIREVFSGSGSISIINLDGSIDVIGNGSSDAAISTGQDGTIELVATGKASDVIVREEIRTLRGDITITSDRNAVFSATGDITSAAGSLTLVADNRDGNFAGSIAMTDGAIFDLGTGRITLIADGEIGLASLVSGNTTDSAVVVQSESGRINDRGDSALDIQAASGTTWLSSRLGIGDGNAIETNLGVLESEVTSIGAFQIAEVDAIQLRSVDTFDGLIDVTAGGTILATDVLSQNQSELNDGGQVAGPGSRDIRLVATGSTSDVMVDQVRAQNSADVVLIADDDILDFDAGDERRVQSDDLFVTANNQNDDGSDAIRLTTAVNDFSGVVTGQFRGDLELQELDSIQLASADANTDTEKVETSNGEIRVFAGESIRVVDLGGIDQTEELLDDVELIAGGDNGRIHLQATDAISLGDAVQIDASQSTIDAVLIQSSEVTLGDQFQIRTGQGVGVARVFAPRPDARLIDTAFYESTSVSTNILEQAAVNDAEGRLTVDIGNVGERGLTINIDWGAETNRFQQIDGLSGDAPPLVVSHVFLESDILDSRVNDRASETAPLNVKFAVRHHESIRVLGESIAQGESDQELVDGRVLSSTDNPITAQSEQAPILENGTASFIIPALSIPVAFFPVRDVIPDLSEPEVFVQSEQSVVLSQSTVTAAESSVSTSVARQEYFQIRALSPDPEGDDLAVPEQLPEDILDGSKLRDLLQQLPDGRYAIQYVLGDGNERSILEVDLRGGRPMIPTEDLDGGPLKLRLIEDDQPTGDRGEDKLDPADDVQRVKAALQNQHSRIPPKSDADPVVTSEHPSQLRDGDASQSTTMGTPELAASMLGLTAAGRRGAGYFSAGKRFLRRRRNAS